MAEGIPLPEKDTKDLDRASVLRVTIGYVRLRESLGNAKERTKHRMEVARKVKGMDSVTEEMFKALDGFLLVISNEGLITFASESVADHLGLREVDVMGHNIRDLVHPQDFMEVAHIFADHDPLVKPDLEHELLQSSQKHFVVRMRSTFSASVRSITRCASFKPIYCSAKVTYQPSTNPLFPYKREIARISVICRVAGTVDLRDMCIGTCVMTKHDIQYNCVYVDNKMKLILGYDPADMMTSNAFVFFHPGDLSEDHVHASHMQMIHTGENKSPAFRALTKWGTWVWVRSLKQCLYDPTTHQPVGIAIYSWLIGPAGAIECNRAFLEQYGSDHLPNVKEQFKSVLGNKYNPEHCYNPNYVTVFPKRESPPQQPTSKLDSVTKTPPSAHSPHPSTQQPRSSGQPPHPSTQQPHTQTRSSHPQLHQLHPSAAPQQDCVLHQHIPQHSPPIHQHVTGFNDCTTPLMPPTPLSAQPQVMTHPLPTGPPPGQMTMHPATATLLPSHQPHPMMTPSQQPPTHLFSDVPPTSFAEHQPPVSVNCSVVTNGVQHQYNTQQVFSPPLTPPENNVLPTLGHTSPGDQGNSYTPPPCSQVMGSTILSPPHDTTSAHTPVVFPEHGKDYYVQNSSFNMTPSPSGSEHYSHSSFSPVGNGNQDDHMNPLNNLPSYVNMPLQQQNGCFNGGGMAPKVNGFTYGDLSGDNFSDFSFNASLGIFPKGGVTRNGTPGIHSNGVACHAQVGLDKRQPLFP
jgi:PAS domain-containing protein